jgi:leucine-rich PPR motif-containing protein
VDEACNVFKQMITKGMRPDSVSYNILIDCLGKAGQLDRAFELFEQSNGSITTHTYNTLRNSLGKQGEVQGLPELFAHMKEKGCP